MGNRRSGMPDFIEIPCGTASRCVNIDHIVHLYPIHAIGSSPGEPYQAYKLVLTIGEVLLDAAQGAELVKQLSGGEVYLQQQMREVLRRNGKMVRE